MGKGAQDNLSVFISLVLRHKPDAAGIALDGHGWADTAKLLDGIRSTGRYIDMGMLEEIVRTDEKGRYSFNEDKTLIRANQGHSLPVDVGLKQAVPPDKLYHGTAERFIGSIKSTGIKPMGRQYVHLSKDYETAVRVGGRHGKPIAIEINAAQMNQDRILFYLSENGVWLTKYVEPKYFAVLYD